MIKEKNVTKEIAKSLNRRFGKTMFSIAPALGIWFDDTEIKYIETKMMTHKLYRLVNGNAAGIGPRENMRLLDFQRSWLLGFLKDKNIPIGVNAFIYYYIGHEQACLKINDNTCGTHSYEASVKHEFLVELWMEKCR